VNDVPSAAIRTTRVVRCEARVVRQLRLTHDTFELVVERAPGSPALWPRAGQFATLKVAALARPRAYSFARDPAREAPGQHTFVIRVVPGGGMSGWLSARNRVGEAVELAGPLGKFTLDERDGPMLFVAGGSGMSAIRSLVEAAARRRVCRPAVVLHGARTAADLYAREMLAGCAADWHPAAGLRSFEVLSHEPATSAWEGPRGLVTEYLRAQVIGDGLVDVSAASAWLCGPAPMIEAATAVLREAGMARERIFRDVFEDAGSPAPVIDNRRCVLCDECLLVRPVADCIVESGGFATGAAGAARAVEPLVPGGTSGLYYNSLVIDAERCIRCSACINACPHGAIAVHHPQAPDTLRQPRRA